MGMGEIVKPHRQICGNNGGLFPRTEAGTRNNISTPVGTFPLFSHLKNMVGTRWEPFKINNLTPYVPTFRTNKEKEYMEFLGNFFPKIAQKWEQTLFRGCFSPSFTPFHGGRS